MKKFTPDDRTLAEKVLGLEPEGAENLSRWIVFTRDEGDEGSVTAGAHREPPEAGPDTLAVIPLNLRQRGPLLLALMAAEEEGWERGKMGEPRATRSSWFTISLVLAEAFVEGAKWGRDNPGVQIVR